MFLPPLSDRPGYQSEPKSSKGLQPHAVLTVEEPCPICKVRLPSALIISHVSTDHFAELLKTNGVQDCRAVQVSQVPSH